MFRLLKSLTGSAVTGSDDTIKTNTEDVKTAGFLLSKTSSMDVMEIPLPKRTELANYFNSISDYSPGSLGTSTVTIPGAPSVRLSKYELWLYKCRIDQSAVPVAERDKLSVAATTVWKHIFGDGPYSTNQPYPELDRPEWRPGTTKKEVTVPKISSTDVTGSTVPMADIERTDTLPIYWAEKFESFAERCDAIGDTATRGKAMAWAKGLRGGASTEVFDPRKAKEALRKLKTSSNHPSAKSKGKRRILELSNSASFTGAGV